MSALSILSNMNNMNILEKNFSNLYKSESKEGI